MVSGRCERFERADSPKTQEVNLLNLRLRTFSFPTMLLENLEMRGG